VAGEMLPGSLRSKLEESFGMIVRQGYGTADVGCLGYECYYKDGMHFAYMWKSWTLAPDASLGLVRPGRE
jgi:phenylacetate-CoA ligase